MHIQWIVKKKTEKNSNMQWIYANRSWANIVTNIPSKTPDFLSHTVQFTHSTFNFYEEYYYYNIMIGRITFDVGSHVDYTATCSLCKRKQHARQKRIYFSYFFTEYFIVSTMDQLKTPKRVIFPVKCSWSIEKKMR